MASLATVELDAMTSGFNILIVSASRNAIKAAWLHGCMASGAASGKSSNRDMCFQNGCGQVSQASGTLMLGENKISLFDKRKRNV